MSWKAACIAVRHSLIVCLITLSVLSTACLTPAQELGTFDQGDEAGDPSVSSPDDNESAADDPASDDTGSSDEDNDNDEEDSSEPDDDSSPGDTGSSSAGDDTDSLEPCAAPPGGDGQSLFRLTCPSRTPYSIHHYFDISPENPSGTMLAYTELSEDGSSPTDVWVCNTDGTGHRRIGSIAVGSSTVGAAPVWISDDLVAYQDLAPGQESVHLQSISDPVQHYSWPGLRISSYSPTAGKIILGGGPQVWTIDPATRSSKILVSPADVQPLVNGHLEPLMARPQFSPDGTKVVFLLRDIRGDGAGPGPFLALVDADGSNLRLLDGHDGTTDVEGRRHAWYDNESLSASVYRASENPLIRIALDGHEIELLAGFGEHGSARPGVPVVVSDDGRYDAAPSYRVLEYEKNSTQANRLLMQAESHGGAYLPFPVLNASGSRVYFNAKGPGDAGPQLYVWVYSGELPQPD